MDGLIAYALSKKFATSYADEVGRRVEQAGFKVQIESDRSILEGAGQPKILYFLPKEDPQQGDGYDEFIYTNDTWEWVGKTDVDLSNYARIDQLPFIVNMTQVDNNTFRSQVLVSDLLSCFNMQTLEQIRPIHLFIKGSQGFAWAYLSTAVPQPDNHFLFLCSGIDGARIMLSQAVLATNDYFSLNLVAHSNFFDSSEYYTKSEIDTMIGDIETALSEV